MTPELNYPQQRARTRGFTLGAPRTITISPDGERILFLRSRAGTDPVTCLWEMTVSDGTERLIADPSALLTGADQVSPEEQARRERAREQAAGVVSYATDASATRVSFTLAGRGWLADTRESGGNNVRELPATTPVFDPRPDPAGERVAYASGGSLRLVSASGTDPLTGTDDRALATAEDPDVSWGVAEFIAAEEMRRTRGFWWAPDGRTILATRVDTSLVQRWHIADPANPATPPTELPYPAAGTPNAEVTLWLIDTERGEPRPVEWERDAFPYVVSVNWSRGALLLVVQSRDQRSMRVLEVNPASGMTALRREDTDPAWVEIVPGVPALTRAGAFVWTADIGGARRLLLDGGPVTPPDLQVRSVLDVDGETVLFTASTDPTSVRLWTYGPAGLARVTGDNDGPAVEGGRRGGETTVVASSGLDHPGTRFSIRRGGSEAGQLRSHAQDPALIPRAQLLRAGNRELATALVLPSWHEAGTEPLPVLMTPYGGPHAQRVLARSGAYLDDQWFAEQGFAVVVVDGRGSPGRGPEWERAIRGDMLSPALEDQVDGLQALAGRYPGTLDLSRVGIRGWSFGGYLAAAAVLRRPDVFHAAVAGAPVTDKRLYDTHYTERYLGHPDQEQENYERCSLLPDAVKLERPLMLIHGLADDNVVAAHTLRLSSALLAAGRSHTVLPLSGVTHMTPQEVVAENLLRLQVDFLRRSLASSVPR